MENLSFPVSFWFVGEGYVNSKYKLVFVGKNARGNPGVIRGAYLDARSKANELWYGAWPYWSYTKIICDKVYGAHSGDCISFTNLVKCNKLEKLSDGYI
jgi:hypothetical protein